MDNKDIIYKILSSNLVTVEDANFFIKNFESFIKGNTSAESIIKSYSFLSTTNLEDIKKEFPKLRTNLLSRKKVKIYTPVTISNKLIAYLHPIFTKFTQSSIVLDPLQDSSIIAGLKFSFDGKIYNLTLDTLNQKKLNKITNKK